MSRRLFYSLLLWLLLPLVPLRLLWRGLRQREYWLYVPERFGVFATATSKPVIWLHCVSVGETRAAAPLVQALQTRYPGHTLLLTHGTPTGRATSEQLFGDSVLRCYLPYDLPFAVRRFIHHFQPRIGLLMETELWFNLVHHCHKQHLPLLLVNARLSERSARRYAKVSRLAGESLQQLAAIGAQTEQDAARLRALGAGQVKVTGNMKFDAAQPETGTTNLRVLFGSARPVFLAASTRDGEEALILQALESLKIPHLLTVIVPRHPQRFDVVASLLEKQGISFVRRSGMDNHETLDGVHVVLGDSMGEMAAYFSACDVALIGGSLLPYGGQNLIEACALGKPVLIGPHTYNFEEVALQAVACGAAQRVADVSGLAHAIEQLFAHPAMLQAMGNAGLEFTERNRGATERTLDLIKPLL